MTSGGDDEPSARGSDLGVGSWVDPPGPASQWAEVARSRYDPDGREELTTVIVRVVAEARGVPPEALRSPVLYDCVDVPALETTLFGSPGAGELRTDAGGAWTVAFRYGDLLVRVAGDGRVSVHEPVPPGRERG
jgi:hypothetical protein